LLAGDEAAYFIGLRLYLQGVGFDVDRLLSIADLKGDVLFQRLGNVDQDSGSRELLEARGGCCHRVLTGADVGEEEIAAGVRNRVSHLSGGDVSNGYAGVHDRGARRIGYGAGERGVVLRHRSAGKYGQHRNTRTPHCEAVPFRKSGCEADCCSVSLSFETTHHVPSLLLRNAVG